MAAEEVRSCCAALVISMSVLVGYDINTVLVRVGV